MCMCARRVPHCLCAQQISHSRGPAPYRLTETETKGPGKRQGCRTWLLQGRSVESRHLLMGGLISYTRANTSHTESTLVKPSHRHTLVSAIRVNPSQYESNRVSRVDRRRQRHHTALLVIRFTPQDAWAPKILQGALSQSESTRVDLSRFGST